MMSFQAPAPGARGCRLAEDGEEIEVGVAHEAPLGLQLVQDVLQAHDLVGTDRSQWAVTGADQRLTELLLRWQQVAQGHTAAWHGREVPAEPLLVAEAEARRCALLGRECGEERLRRAAHER